MDEIQDCQGQLQVQTWKFTERYISYLFALFNIFLHFILLKEVDSHSKIPKDALKFWQYLDMECVSELDPVSLAYCIYVPLN